MDLAVLIINFGLLVVSGAAAVVAIVQARSADEGRVAAERARDAAVAAQRDAAVALDEANQIAREAQDLLAAGEKRATERHRASWEPSWDWEAGVWSVVNRGPDVAHTVRVSIESPINGRQEAVLDHVLVDHSVQFGFPQFAGGGGFPWVRWHVDWQSALGVPHEASGEWDH